MLLAWMLAASLAFADAANEPSAQARRIDPDASRIEFELHTRWGQSLQGRFPEFDGEVEVLPDARRRVHVRLRADALIIVNSARYTKMARDRMFFDVTRHPRIEFDSDPYTLDLLRNGGTLGGQLRLRGITRREQFRVQAVQCSASQNACLLDVRGRVNRADYGMDRWSLAVSPEVDLHLRLRLQAEPAE